jgi:hypothetical protein
MTDEAPTRGRPSKYDPAFCETVEGTLAQGFSLAVAAGVIGVTRQTLDAWTKEHPEFLDAVKIGRARGALIWETRLAKLADTNEGNATGVIFGLKNRLPEDWKDKTETEHSGALAIEKLTRTVVDPKS